MPEVKERNCANCGHSFLAPLSELRRGSAKYCSIPCRTAVQTGRPSGMKGKMSQIIKDKIAKRRYEGTIAKTKKDS